MGYLVLKHCLTTELTEGNDPKHENSKGIALLAMSTLFSERFLLYDHFGSIGLSILILELHFCGWFV